MFFPYGTDAPIYHWPFTTVALIVVNAVVLCAELAAPEQVAPFILVFGNGLHPVQWITNNFLHAGIFHLVGNMLFLWSFGLVVEGKLGWYKTLAVYLGIGAVYGLVVQTIMLGSSGGALGASGAIFGFMAMCLVWAPENQMQCILLIGPRAVRFEMKVITLVGLFLVFQLVLAGLSKIAMNTEVLHLIGASVGFLAASVLLKSGQVDCEYWDVFSIWAGRNRLSRDERKAIEAEAEAEARRQHEQEIERGKHEAACRQIRQMLADGNPAFAARAHQHMKQKLLNWSLPETDLRGLIQALHKESLWSESVPLMNEYVTRHPQNAALMQLKLAEVFLLHANRPAEAMWILHQIDPTTLEPSHRALLKRLRAKAEETHRQSPNEATGRKS
jgi:membrane associated rhomboid family serine protease